MYVVESDFMYKGFRCVGIFGDMGHRCGYVGIPKSHPLYGKNYSDTLKAKARDVEGEPIGKRGIMSLFAFPKDPDDAIQMDVYFNVHGSLTYAGGGEQSTYPVESDLWWLGFDCGHAGDRVDIEALKKYFGDTERVKRNLEIGGYLLLDGDVVRTKDYVQEQCKDLADQIIEYCEKFEEDYEWI